MAVVSVDERARGREATTSFNQAVLVRSFLVEMSALTDGPQAAVDATGVPVLGDRHPDNSAVIADRKTVEDTENRLFFIVSVQYTTPRVGAISIITNPNPLNDEPDIRWSSKETQVLAIKDINRNPIENAAGDAFDPPLVERDFEQEVTIGRNENSFIPDRANRFLGRVNSAPIQIAGKSIRKGQGRLTQFSGDNDERNGIDFFRVNYKIELKPLAIIAGDGAPLFWRREVLNQGFNELIPTLVFGKSKVQSVDAQTNPVTSPVKLDEDGFRLAKGAPAVFLTFTTVFSADFSQLGLPANL